MDYDHGGELEWFYRAEKFGNIMFEVGVTRSGKETKPCTLQPFISLRPLDALGRNGVNVEIGVNAAAISFGHGFMMIIACVAWVMQEAQKVISTAGTLPSTPHALIVPAFPQHIDFLATRRQSDTSQTSAYVDAALI